MVTGFSKQNMGSYRLLLVLRPRACVVSIRSLIVSIEARLKVVTVLIEPKKSRTENTNSVAQGDGRPEQRRGSYLSHRN